MIRMDAKSLLQKCENVLMNGRCLGAFSLNLTLSLPFGTQNAILSTRNRHGVGCHKQPKRKTTMKMRMKKGFTLIEIMIVVAIIAILAAIAIPNFVKYRK